MQVTKLIFVSIVLLYDIYTVSANPQTHMFVKPKTKDDNLQCCDRKIKNVYDSVLNLLVYKMKTCIKIVEDNHSLDPDSDLTISNYLGFPDETIKLINDAFTELFYLHIRLRINIGNLAAAFLYSCDLEHMRDPNANRVLNVRENFEKIFENLGISNNYVVDIHGEDELVNNLQNSIKAVGKLVDSWFRVSIPLLKNRLLVGVSTNTTVNNLKGRFISEYKQKYAESYERETDVNIVIENHLEIMRKVIPDLFGFAFNHIVLLTELRKFEIVDLNEPDTLVLRSSDVFPLIAIIFINRYFAFKNSNKDPLKNEIFPFFDFFDSTAEHLGRTRSIQNDKNKVENYDFNKHMWDMTDKALNRMLVIFGNEDAEKWIENRTIKINYKNTNVDKDQLLALMKENNRDATEFLEEIKRKCGSYYDDHYKILRKSMYM